MTFLHENKKFKGLFKDSNHNIATSGERGEKNRNNAAIKNSSSVRFTGGVSKKTKPHSKPRCKTGVRSPSGKKTQSNAANSNGAAVRCVGGNTAHIKGRKSAVGTRKSGTPKGDYSGSVIGMTASANSSAVRCVSHTSSASHTRTSPFLYAIFGVLFLFLFASFFMVLRFSDGFSFKGSSLSQTNNISALFVSRVDTGEILDGDLLEIKPSGSVQLLFNYAPRDLKSVSLEFLSSNPEIADIDQTGYITAKMSGNTRIKISANNTFYKEIDVQVMPKNNLTVIKPDRNYIGEYYFGKERIYYGPHPEKMICLTFDDGPNGETTEYLLDELKARGAQCTFFVVGRNARNHPETLKRILSEGHTLGNHTYAHPSPGGDLATEIQSIQQCSDIVENATGSPTKYLRAPYAKTTQAMIDAATELDMPFIFWTIDTRDWAAYDSDTIYNELIKAKEGDIILLHDLHGDEKNRAAADTTIPAVLKMIDEYTAQGYTFVSIDEYYARTGMELVAGKKY